MSLPCHFFIQVYAKKFATFYSFNLKGFYKELATDTLLNGRFVIYSSERRRLRYILTFSSTRLQPEVEKSGVSGGKYSNSSAMSLICLSYSLMPFAVALSWMHILTCSRSRGRKGTKALTRFLSITLLYFRPPVHLRRAE